MTHSPTRSLRAVELFCGIGGFAAAVESRFEVAAAVDINHAAVDVYRHNFDHPVWVASVESIARRRLESWDADLWWLSPPCQPFTKRGKGLDIEDVRAAGLLSVLARLALCRPRHVALENVPGFVDSTAHRLLRARLESLDYQIQEHLICPTRFGLPNRRRRFYLVASRGGLRAPVSETVHRQPLHRFLDPEPSEDLWVSADLENRYRHALNIVGANDEDAVTSCFTSAYGHSPVRSGSYLRTAVGLRRFSPIEILRLLGYGTDFSLPPGLPTQTAWRLVGNSLSLPAVRFVLSAIPSA